MSAVVLADTGPLVAYLVRQEARHAWACERFRHLRPPLLTCEAVIAEAAYLLGEEAGNATPVLDLIERGVLQIAFELEDELQAVRRLMERYRNVPMSLADACLVRMAEIREGAAVLTLDSDFLIYRKHGRHVIPTIMPT
jgi:predicted nucleic acid-binding protein